ncbi:hypothetical protein BD410DRAFT_740174 [Rickenella mellea]|uniref:Uncharacterized protein n=1 Tax=Rickenella mellea TaxID=50990 RepID=A0A4Y7QK77_9AGAM|nr:hypothetical protein BD410DRAFT_740174 [Rickenella mellea]
MVNSTVNDAREDLPRISMDSFYDWQRVRRNYLTAALGTLEKQLAEKGRSHELSLYQQHIMLFVDKAFDISKANLRVNGRNYEEYDNEDEDEGNFDEALDRHIHTLSEQRHWWELDIALKRRTTPKEVETLMLDLIDRQQEYDNSVVPVDNSDMEVDINEMDNNCVVGGWESIHRQVALLSDGIKQDVPEQLERANRLKLVNTEISSLKL